MSGEKIVFIHTLSPAVVLPLSCLDSLLFYDGVSNHGPVARTLLKLPLN